MFAGSMGHGVGSTVSHQAGRHCQVCIPMLTGLNMNTLHVALDDHSSYKQPAITWSSPGNNTAMHCVLSLRTPSTNGCKKEQSLLLHQQQCWQIDA